MNRKNIKIILFLFIIIFLTEYNLSYSQLQQMVSKSYNIKHRHTEDFTPLIQALLSKKGTIRESQEMNIIIVTDYPSNLTQIDSLININDKPLRQVTVTIELYLCSKGNDNTIPPEFEIVRKLTENFYNFNQFEKIDRALITAQENSSTQFIFAGEKYSVFFVLDYVEEDSKSVSFRNFRLTEIDRNIRGKIEKVVAETSTKIPDNTQTMLSASKYKNTDKSLVVIVGVIIS